MAEDVGVIGFVLKNPIIDALGLNDEGFVHVFGRDAGRFARAVMKQRPALLVLVSTSVHAFRPRYPSGEFFTQMPGFDKRYVQLADRALAHGGLPLLDLRSAQTGARLPPRYSFGLNVVMMPALTVDDLFRNVKNPPARSRVPPLEPKPRTEHGASHAATSRCRPAGAEVSAAV